MSSSPVGNHAGTGTSSTGPVIAEPSFGERVQTLLYLARTGSLSTMSRKQPGFPYGSIMPYAPDAQGRPAFLISTMAMHTQNLKADPRASLLVTQPDTEDNPLSASRVTLLGKVLPVPESDVDAVRKLYLERHANSSQWVDFQDFSFYRMDVVDVYYIGGFGVMGWVSAGEFGGARRDPLVDSANGIIQHMNADHSVALAQLARAFAGIESDDVTMTAVDRLGFQVRLKTPDGMRAVRIPFLREVNTPIEARTVLVEMVAQARQK
jgi:heme iron utilization protein